MKEHAGAICAIVLFGFTALGWASQDDWVRIDGLGKAAQGIAVYSDGGKILYAASGSRIFKSADAGDTWESEFKSVGLGKKVNYIKIGTGAMAGIYAATGSGLYAKKEGAGWRRLFRGSSAEEADCKVIAFGRNQIYLGTGAGLFLREAGSELFRRVKGVVGRAKIYSIVSAYGENPVLAASDEGVFRSIDYGNTWEKTLISRQAGDDGGETGDDESENGPDEGDFRVNSLAVDAEGSGAFMAATTRGVYTSIDNGVHWEALTSQGLPGESIDSVYSLAKFGICCVVKSRIYLYKRGEWKDISIGLPVTAVNYLEKEGDFLYAATGRGLYKRAIVKDIPAGQSSVNPGPSGSTQNDPLVQEVFEVAIKYAEVEPEKISKWRRLAAKKAILPQLNVGLDRNVSDLWHWEGGSTTKSDDDVLRHGKDALEWSVGLSWDLSDLIWNDAQTSIDVRSRLMVQLREDILDEVTKTYFERLRLKLEMENTPIFNRKKQAEQELRLRELTATLDALTGGWFSKQLQN